MKTILLTGWLLLLYSLSFAQFKISGKIIGGKLPDSVYINLPFVYGYYTENTIGIAVNKSGRFEGNIPVKSKRFGSININRKMSTIFLTPGKSLILDVNGSDTLITRFAGTAAAENRLLYPMGFEDTPFFSKDSTYAKLSMPQLKEQVINKWMVMRNEKLKTVQESNLSLFDKSLSARKFGLMP
jgi:hypothetical protein